MKILVTGRYEPHYNRNLVIIKGLKEHGISLTEAPFRKKREFILPDLQGDIPYDFVFLPSFTHYDVRFIKRKLKIPLIFDPLISRYLSKIYDTKSVRPYSPRALKNYLKDKLSMDSADIILADTEAHRQYFIDTFGIGQEKIHVVPVGVDIETFTPDAKYYESKSEKSDKFLIGTYSSYLPLHGIRKIIDAAEILKNEQDIKFSLIGKGGLLPDIKRRLEKLDLNNVEIIDWLPYEQLPGQLNRYDICLGIFGDSLKARSVIPNKIYHFCAVGKPVITMDSPAIREIFTPGKDIITTDGSPTDLAGQIIRLKNNPDLFNGIASRGMQLIRANYNQNKIAEKFLQAVKDFRER